MVPKVFISYAWETEDHRAWVKSLADKLLSDGIEAILDQYDVSPGDRLPQFMEQSVSAADYVLIVCTPTYKKKADGRMGGVGYEGHIISNELYSKSNERKFIPLLKEGEPEESMPSFLAGKLAIDLRGGLDAAGYDDLRATLFHLKRKPPVRVRSVANTRSRSFEKNESPDDPVRIVGIITDEVGEPRNDGTPGCALYRVPFRLSRRPSALWADLFVKTWDSPPRWSTMHRPGIARVSGDKIILDGTTIEEVRDVHKETLVLCVDVANKMEREYLLREQEKRQREERRREEHMKNVTDIANEIEF